MDLSQLLHEIRAQESVSGHDSWTIADVRCDGMHQPQIHQVRVAWRAGEFDDLERHIADGADVAQQTGIILSAARRSGIQLMKEFLPP